MPVKAGTKVDRGKYFCTKCMRIQFIQKSGDIIDVCRTWPGDDSCLNDEFLWPWETSA